MKNNVDNLCYDLIKKGHLSDFKIEKNCRNISPALVLYFDNHSPVAIKKEKWKEYSDLLCSLKFLSDVF